MNQELPSFLEDDISQIPALQLLQNLGWEYLTPKETVTLRAGKMSCVMLEGVLVPPGCHSRERLVVCHWLCQCLMIS